MLNLKNRRDSTPVLLLLFLCLSLTMHRLIKVGSSIGMLNTDTEGTAWWIWSRCEGQTQLNHANGIAYPNGFDLSRFPTFNLLDELRIQFARFFGCSTSSIISQLALFPTICLFGNCLAGYFLGRTLFQNKHSAFALGMVCAFSSQILLATRTPLANNVLFLGLISVAFAAKWLQSGERAHLVLLIAFQTLQTLVNVYNGVATLILLGTILLAFPNEQGLYLSRRIKGFFGSLFASVLGLGPLLASQIYLLTQTELQEVYRPVDQGGEILPLSSLFAKDRGIYNWLAPDSLPRPEAGWISSPLLILLLVLLLFSLSSRNGFKSSNRTFVSTCLFIALLLIVLIWDVPPFGFLRSFYFSVLTPLRGVSNFAKIVPVLITIACLKMIQPILLKVSSGVVSSTKVNFVLGSFCLLFLIDNVPISNSYWSLRDVRPFIESYQTQQVTRSIGPVAQFPDFMYGPKWGLPQRFIQLAQMGDHRPRLNGRNFLEIYDSTSAMPLPVDRKTLNVLTRRGATTVILHRALIPADDLEKSISFLRSQGFAEHSHHRELQNDLTYQSLAVTIFELN
jgi:hypothetical protein